MQLPIFTVVETAADDPKPFEAAWREWSSYWEIMGSIMNSH